jgi:hypothetical protein
MSFLTIRVHRVQEKERDEVPDQALAKLPVEE